MDGNAGTALGLAPFETDWFLPDYRPVRCGDWQIQIARSVIAQGYWGPTVFMAEMPVLLRGSETWMSLTPLEVESQTIGLALARGHVVIMGLGMGWAAAAAALREQVTRVTVIERDSDVLALHEKLDLFARCRSRRGRSCASSKATRWNGRRMCRSTC